jgi:hypothetical protein
MRTSLSVLGTAAAALVLLLPVSASAAPTVVSPAVQVSPTNSPFPGADADGPPCNGVPGEQQVGVNFPGTEVEPWVAVNPANQANLIGGWQQDRWSDGGANADLFAHSQDGGRTWQLSALQPRFSRCTGGEFERATDPWVSISPNGTAYAMSLSLNIAQNNDHAMQVARSTDGGRTWGPTIDLRRDTSFNVLNDKNTLTADRLDSRFAYAVWDRLEFPNENASRRAGERAIGFRGPTWFARTTNGGTSWEPARLIFDPGQINQTIGNQIVQTRSATLVNGFNLIFNVKNAHQLRGMHVAVIRSSDRGATWTSSATLVDRLLSAGVTDPTTGAAVRTGDILPEFAAHPGNETVYAVWQDARTTGGARDQIAIARSTDGGRTWTTLSHAINKVAATQAFNPAITVLPDGTIGVLYQDFRNDDAAAPLVTSTWLLHSHDGGVTWEESKVGNEFDMTGAPRAGGFFPGDYMGLGSTTTGTFHPFFPQATGTQAVPATNIYAARAN